MALTKVTVLDRIEILENAIINVRYGRKIMDDDGVTELARNYHRASFAPGTVINTLPAGPVRAIANLIWTPAVVAAYLASIKKLP